MIRLSILVSILMGFLMVSADDYIESFNIISDNYDDNVQDVQVIRPINGGTVLLPTFDESCPEEIKAPFSYACKIVEEYMPPCLPLQILVSCKSINSSTGKTISKVVGRTKENFGASIYYHNAYMSTIKGVVLAELCHNSSVTYLDSIPDIEFLTQEPDIKITYNNQYLNDISFSLDPNPGEQYDFVSIAIRDILIGLGISHGFQYNNDSKGLQHPAQEYTPYEVYIDGLLGNRDNPAKRLEQATKGELVIRKNMINGQDLKLYAPSTWQNKTSLNYFIPLEGCCISSILAYDFCKGQVTRSLSDKYSDFFFRTLLGWRPDYTTGSDSSVSSGAGSTSLFMPYNGTLSLGQQYGIQKSFQKSVQPMRVSDYPYTDNEELNQYLSIYNPLNPLYEYDMRGHSVSILMKDGSWDEVEVNGDTMEGVALSMSDWKFNFDPDQYARTVDGYLRAKMTINKDMGGYISYTTTYFVVDYLPQRVSLNYSRTPAAPVSTATVSSNDMVRIYFANTEGLDRIVLERLRQGARVPSKIEVTDFRKGYYDTTVDKVTTFTAVGYNANGTSRSIPITVVPPSITTSVTLSVDNQYINIHTTAKEATSFRYEIRALTQLPLPANATGTATSKIDISDLSNGMYVVTVYDDSSNEVGSLKFMK